MKHLSMGHWIAICVLLLTVSSAMAGSFAAAVVSYDPGATPAAKWPAWDPFTNAWAALGAPDGLTEGFMGAPNILSVFNPADGLDEIVSIGEGGHLTLWLENFLVVGEGPELGVFTHVGLAEADWENPSGTAGSPAVAFGVDPVTVEASADGQQWASLGQVTMDRPTNFYADAASPYLASGEGLAAADFSQPFTSPLSDFSGKNWGQILTLLDGSAGGTWLDLSSTGLSQVKFVRFSVADDANSLTNLNFEVDSVSIAAGHIGAVAPEPVSAMLLLAGGLAGLRRRRS